MPVACNRSRTNVAAHGEQFPKPTSTLPDLQVSPDTVTSEITRRTQFNSAPFLLATSSHTAPEYSATPNPAPRSIKATQAQGQKPYRQALPCCGKDSSTSNDQKTAKSELQGRLFRRSALIRLLPLLA